MAIFGKSTFGNSTFGGDDGGSSIVARPTYAQFFLDSRSSVVQLETLEITIYHPPADTTFRLVRNKMDGLSASLEDGSPATFSYLPMRISSLGARDNLDTGFKVELGDLGEIVPLELDLVAAADSWSQKPTVIYRAYRSDDLSAPMFGPITLEIAEFSFTKQGAAFEAKAPSLNVTQTGEVYSVARFPSLRGFV